jgi:hypothetical protein
MKSRKKQMNIVKTHWWHYSKQMAIDNLRSEEKDNEQELTERQKKNLISQNEVMKFTMN